MPLWSLQSPQQPDPSDVKDVDYVLVGAGLSGIFLVAEALQQGFKSVVVIDKKDR
jgi:cation diffusion facilitator CzcD-associated flavoprotein CzcO